MSIRKSCLALLILSVPSFAFAQASRIEQLFDAGWKFHLGDTLAAEMSSFNDQSWRTLDLPHDWSIERLPNQKPGQVVGPFSKTSPGATATGYTLGGTGWYRKTFVLNAQEQFSTTLINFDGVYMNCEVWVNGKMIGSHPYGYTAFQVDISDYLNPVGTANVIAVKVKNEGKNSRWYSGSGIYRHVWMIQKKAVHLVHDGVSITTERISSDEALLKLDYSVQSLKKKEAKVKLLTRIYGPDGKIAMDVETPVKTVLSGAVEFSQTVRVPKPQCWSIEMPQLYKAETQVVADNEVTDKVATNFGIRTIHFDAKTGFTLNGKKVLLKGGCMHHDNGFLGSATIDRAEERRVELMKNNGFNAIRTSHNPVSNQFLDACDRLGVLVMEEAFDMWERPKNPEDYHLYFKDWWKKDLRSMVFRDRNHPSVILWSIGNELNERADSLGYVITKQLADEVRRLDSTRPVTEAICGFWDHPGQEWSTTDPAFASLDVCGYNYLWGNYKPDHDKFPNRVMVGTESYPAEIYDNWKQVEANSWVIGDFVWTAMDYLGETGCGNTHFSDNPMRVGLLPWPWFNAFCGDIDLCGFKKPQLLYRNVVWKNSDLELLVHTPIPAGKKEVTSYWGWPDETPSWNWFGCEGTEMDVRVFSRSSLVRLELNGKVIAEQVMDEGSKYIANFKVPYVSGVLRAIALDNGKVVATKELKTTGAPSNIKLTADRSTIHASRNDLSYVRVEITDHQGNVIPNANLPVTLSVGGIGEIAGSGNACPTDLESFNSKVCKTFQGKSIVILRPISDQKKGVITLKVEAKGLSSGEIKVQVL